MAAMAGAGPGPAEGPCVLCCGELDVVALGRCEHPICYRCSVRMRALCGVRYCAVCREELRQVRPGPGLRGPRAGRGSARARGGRRRCWVEPARPGLSVLCPAPGGAAAAWASVKQNVKKMEFGVSVCGVKSAGLALVARNRAFAPYSRRHHGIVKSWDALEWKGL